MFELNEIGYEEMVSFRRQYKRERKQVLENRKIFKERNFKAKTWRAKPLKGDWTLIFKILKSRTLYSSNNAV